MNKILTNFKSIICLSKERSLILGYICLLLSYFTIFIGSFSLGLYSILIIVFSLLSILILPGYGLLHIIYRGFKFLNIVEKLLLSIILSIFTIISGYIILTSFNTLTRLSFTLFLIVTSTIFYIIASRKCEISERKDENKLNRSIIIALLTIFFISLSWRIFYIVKAYPLFLGWDTPRYVIESVWFTQGWPIRYPNGLLFMHYPVFYMMGAVFYSLFRIFHIIPFFISVIDSLSIFSLYLLYKKIFNDDRVVLVAVLLYNLSFFSFRFYSDLYRDLILNFLLPIGIYFVIDGHDKRDLSKFMWSGIIFGLAVNVHSQATYRIAFYIIIYLMSAFIFQSKPRILVKGILIMISIIVIALIPYQTYHVIMGTEISIYKNLLSGSKTYLTFKSSIKKDILWSIPSPTKFWVNESFGLLLGSLILIIKGRKKNILWFLLCTISLIFIFELPYIGYFSQVSQRAFYYYGIFSFLLKSVALFVVTDSLASHINIGKIIIPWKSLFKKGSKEN